MISRTSFFCAAYDTERDKAQVWELRKSLAGDISDFDDEYASTSDRDYKITRKGTMYETEYTAVPLDKSKMKKKYLEAREEMRGKVTLAVAAILAQNDSDS